MSGQGFLKSGTFPLTRIIHTTISQHFIPLQPPPDDIVGVGHCVIMPSMANLIVSICSTLLYGSILLPPHKLKQDFVAELLGHNVVAANLGSHRGVLGF